MKKTVLGFAIGLLCVSQAHAAWRVERDGPGLAITGYGTNKAGVGGFVRLRCTDRSAALEVDTSDSIAKPDQLELYQESAVTLIVYRDSNGDHPMVLKSEPRLSIGETLVFASRLDALEAKVLLNAIVSGEAIGFSPIHKKLQPEYNAINVGSSGYSAVILAVAKKCAKLL